MEISGRQLDVRGKNSRQMSGLELQIWETWNKKVMDTDDISREQRAEREEG